MFIFEKWNAAGGNTAFCRAGRCLQEPVWGGSAETGQRCLVFLQALRGRVRCPTEQRVGRSAGLDVCATSSCFRPTAPIVLTPGTWPHLLRWNKSPSVEGSQGDCFRIDQQPVRIPVYWVKTSGLVLQSILRENQERWLVLKCGLVSWNFLCVFLCWSIRI